MKQSVTSGGVRRAPQPAGKFYGRRMLMSFSRAVRCGISTLGALAMVALVATEAAAQDKVATVTGGFDVSSQYNFRGIRQNTEGASLWPFVDLGLSPFKGDGGLKAVTVNAGMWNAFHTQI